MFRTTLVIASLSLAGCSSVEFMNTTQDCAGRDWYRLGQRDGAESGRSNADSYKGCTVNEAAYAKGLEDGRWDRARRRF